MDGPIKRSSPTDEIHGIPTGPTMYADRFVNGILKPKVTSILSLAASYRAYRQSFKYTNRRTKGKSQSFSSFDFPLSAARMALDGENLAKAKATARKHAQFIRRMDPGQSTTQR